jgi:hypothetical protein
MEDSGAGVPLFVVLQAAPAEPARGGVSAETLSGLVRVVRVTETEAEARAIVARLGAHPMAANQSLHYWWAPARAAAGGRVRRPAGLTIRCSRRAAGSIRLRAGRLCRTIGSNPPAGLEPAAELGR